MIEYEFYDWPILHTVYIYDNTQFQVNQIVQTQDNGQKAYFWLFKPLKKAFLHFLNDPAWVIGWPTHEHHEFYQNMQYKVNPMHQTQENGQTPRFWLFGSFKKAFL